MNFLNYFFNLALPQISQEVTPFSETFISHNILLSLTWSRVYFSVDVDWMSMFVIPYCTAIFLYHYYNKNSKNNKTPFQMWHDWIQNFENICIRHLYFTLIHIIHTNHPCFAFCEQTIHRFAKLFIRDRTSIAIKYGIF